MKSHNNKEDFKEFAFYSFEILVICSFFRFENVAAALQLDNSTYTKIRDSTRKNKFPNQKIISTKHILNRVKNRVTGSMTAFDAKLPAIGTSDVCSSI